MSAVRINPDLLKPFVAAQEHLKELVVSEVVPGSLIAWSELYKFTVRCLHLCKSGHNAKSLIVLIGSERDRTFRDADVRRGLERYSSLDVIVKEVDAAVADLLRECAGGGAEL